MELTNKFHDFAENMCQNWREEGRIREGMIKPRKEAAKMRSKKGMFMVTLLSGLILIMGSVVPSMVQAQSKEPVKIGCLIPLSPPGDPASGKRIALGSRTGHQICE